MKKGVFIGMGAILAALTCYAAVGSIISSVNLGYHRPFTPHCIYRDASYIYTMGGIGAVTCILQYTTTGSLVESIWLKDPYWLSDLDTCHLGSQFFCGTDWGFPPYYLYFFRVSDGSVVSSFTINPPGYEYDTVVAWDGTHYYVALERNYGEFARYTPAGAYAGKWKPAGWPSNMDYLQGIAVSRYACNAAGRYLIAHDAYYGRNKHVIINMESGSFITSWSLPLSRGTGAVCGHSTQASRYGVAHWVQLEDGFYDWAFEVDIDGHAAASVVPASLGKVKAIYR